MDKRAGRERCRRPPVHFRHAVSRLADASVPKAHSTTTSCKKEGKRTFPRHIPGVAKGRAGFGLPVLSSTATRLSPN